MPQHTDYSEVGDYFAAYALVGDRLTALEVPATIVASEDDPIIPADDLERIDSIELLTIEKQQYGGHCGFIENFAARSWIEDRLLRSFRQIPAS